MAFKILPALLGVMAIAACEQGVEVTIAGREGAPPLIGVVSHNADFHARIDQASIFPADGNEALPSWEAAGRTRAIVSSR